MRWGGGLVALRAGLVLALMGLMGLLAACGGAQDSEGGRAFVQQIAAVAPIGASAGGPTSAPPSMKALSSTAADAVPVSADGLLDWAEYRFASLFASGPSSFELDYAGARYVVRAYANGNFLGVRSDGSVWGLGPFNNGVLTGYGTIGDWAPQVRAEACQANAGGDLCRQLRLINRAPRATVLASGDVRSGLTGASVTLGGLVRLDASTSTDDDRDTLSIEWALLSRPAGSNLSLPSITATVIEWRADVLGAYTFQLKVTDPKGASSTQQVTITADNRAPSAALLVTPQFTPVPTNAPTQAVTSGANVLLDGSGATDPDGDALSLVFELTERPPGSAAALAVTGKTARFSADLAGLYRLRVRGSDGRGGSYEALYSFDANNRAPNPVLLAGATAGPAQGGQTTLQASVGYDVVLDSAGSSDPDGDAFTREWLLGTRPAGSTAALSSSGPNARFSPDVLGEYVVTLTLRDARGATSLHTTRVQVNNRRPVANVTSNAQPLALPSVPNVRLPLGTQVTLRGSPSVDADGDALTYLWTVEARPAGSSAALSSPQSADPTFTADVEGSYVFRLRVSDPSGAASERSIGLDVGSYAPVAVVDRGRITLVAGETARASAALSYDEDGDSLSFQWTLDARPAGSSASIATPNSAELSLTPDLPGTYVAAVTVRDGRSASIAYVTLQVLASTATSVTLSFAPDNARYSLGLDRLIATATNPDTVRIVNPFNGAVRTVALPAGVKNFSLSPDGLLAAVLHEGSVSLVDLNLGTLLRTSATGGAHTDAFVSNAGVVMLIGQTGGQWVAEPVVTINGRTGQKIVQNGATSSSGFAFFYGTQLGVFADRQNKVFFVAQGLSPSDISFFQIDPASHQVTRTGDSPYHGDYSIGAPLFLNETQSLVFTALGTYFRTDSLAYAGRLGGVSALRSLSHSASAEELLVLPDGPSLADTYKRYTGALLLPASDLPLPSVAGQASYGLAVFHSAAGRHVVLVQTGSAQPRDAAARYHLVMR